MENLSGQVHKTEKYYFAHGGLADIWKGIWESASSGAPLQVAIKVIRASWREPTYLERLGQKLLREGRVWSQLQYPHITPFYGVSFDADRPQSPCLVCPYYSNGDLTAYTQKHPLIDKLAMLAQVATGLAYLHNIKPHAVVHGDVKGSNILVNDKNQATLADFGLSRIVESSGFTTKSVGGTCRWMAYELLAPCESEEDDDCVPPLTTASDVWAFGMTILEVLTGRIPFMHIRNDPTVILTVMKGGLPPQPIEIKDDIWRLLLHCWNSNPRNRPSMNVVATALGIIGSKSLSTHEIDALIHFLSAPSFDEPTMLDTAQEQSYPYPCHWPGCHKAFSDLGSCQEHECCHWENEKRRISTFSERQPHLSHH